MTTINPPDNTCLLEVEGRLDAMTAPALEARLRELIAAGCRLMVVDMAALQYVSSSGLRVLLLAQRRLQSVGGRLMLRAVPPNVWKVLCLAGFDRIFSSWPADPAAPWPPAPPAAPSGAPSPSGAR